MLRNTWKHRGWRGKKPRRSSQSPARRSPARHSPGRRSPEAISRKTVPEKSPGKRSPGKRSPGRRLPRRPGRLNDILIIEFLRMRIFLAKMNIWINMNLVSYVKIQTQKIVMPLPTVCYFSESKSKFSMKRHDRHWVKNLIWEKEVYGTGAVN